MSDLIAKFPTYGICRKEEYRLSGSNLKQTQNALFRACKDREKNIPPRTIFESYRYLDSGWEWSAFKDGNTVIKVPAGIFAETEDPRYVKNTEFNYSIIGKYIDPSFIAQTKFSDKLPNIRQPLLQHLPEKILFSECDSAKWRSLFIQLLHMINAEEWLPDLNIHECSNGFKIRSVMTDETGIPKIMDFTAYFDVFRLYEERTHSEVCARRQRLLQIIGCLK